MVKYTACICEGGAERVILDLLLDHDKLIFGRNELLEEEIKVDVINVITAPEIEMLIICNERKYKDFKKRKNMSPNGYCKAVLKMKRLFGIC